MRGHLLQRLRGHIQYAHCLPVASLLGLSEVRSAPKTGRAGKSWLLPAFDHNGTQVPAQCWSNRTETSPP